MERAPTGEITLVFTDMEGSTARWERDQEGTHRLLLQHDSAMRRCIQQFEGYECKTAGDSFMVAFADPEAALRFSLAARDEMDLINARVRIGVHRGPVLSAVDPTTGRLDYFGPPVNKAARLEGAASAGQILVSDEARMASIASGDPVGPWLDLGEHVLRGIEGRHRLWQLGSGAFGRPRTVEARLTNLPARPDSFIGRQEELNEIREMVARGERLVTVLGPGGAGKTRLSQRAAAELLGEAVDSAWFCDLSDARTPDDVVGVVSGVLGVPPSKDMNRQVGWAIAGRGKTLLILDNFEQIIDAAAATVGAWAALAPKAVFLSTSRIPLRLRGERTVSLASLPLADGIKLLMDRGQGVDEADPDAANLVKQLDGLPLAIELAAARTRTMSVSQVLGRLGQRFRLLSGGAADLPGRHRALRATLDWSWDLLTEDERRALGQLTVFEGGFTLEAAEAVLDVEDWATDVVQGLVEHSLVQRDRHAGRYHMLLSVIEYGRERLGELGGGAEAEARHGKFFASFGQERFLQTLSGPDPGARRALLAEQDNLVVACRRAVARGDAHVAIGTGAALSELVEMKGPLPLGVELAELVLSMNSLSPAQRRRAALSRWRFLRRLGGFDGPPEELEALRTEALGSGDLQAASYAAALQGAIYEDLGRNLEALRYRELAVEGARALGDRGMESTVLAAMTSAMRTLGRYPEAEATAERALTITRERGDRHLEGGVLMQIGLGHFEQGRPAEAVTVMREALATLRAAGDRRLEGVAMSNLGMALRELGRWDEAAEQLNGSLMVHREVANVRYLGVAMGNLGDLYFTRGRLSDAMRTYEEALEVHRRIENRRHECVVLVNQGELLATLGQAALAVSRFEAAIEIARAIGVRRLQGVAHALLANAARELDELDAARAHIGSALEIQAGPGQERGRGISMRILALIQAQQGQLDTAAETAAEALALLRQKRDPLEVLLALLAVAEVAWRAGDKPRALAALAEAEPLADPESLGARELARARALIIGKAPQASS